MKLLCIDDLNYRTNLDKSSATKCLQLFFNTDIVKFKKGKVYKAKYVKEDSNNYMGFKRYRIINEYNQEVVLIEFLFFPYFHKVHKNKNKNK